MAFNALLLSIENNNGNQFGVFYYYRLRLSESGRLEIVSFQKQGDQKLSLEAKGKLRESFRLFFRNHPDRIMIEKSLSGDEENQSLPGFVHRQTSSLVLEFNDILQEIFQLTVEKIPLENQSYMAGMAINTYLKEYFDPHTKLVPLELIKSKKENAFGVGVKGFLYKRPNGSFGFSLFRQPVRGSSAEDAGLKRGDMILSFDDLEIGKLSSSLSLEDIHYLLKKRINGPEGSNLELGILGVCDSEEKKVTLTRRPVVLSDDWLVDNLFIDLTENGFFSCEEEDGKTQDLENHRIQYPFYSESKNQALYVPLATFIHREDLFSKNSYPLCNEFLSLIQKDFQNPSSRGMIIDLRGNRGGKINEVVCMLDLLIEAENTENILSSWPVKDGEVSFEGEPEISYPFERFTSNISYNKNIVVLVDENSVSTSEIFAGTIQDMKRGWVVGMRTYGKGSIQKYNIFSHEYTELDESHTNNNSSSQGNIPHEQKTQAPLVHFFTSHLYTLNSGRSPQGYGIIPDFYFSITGEPNGKTTQYAPLQQREYNSIQVGEFFQWEQNRLEEWSRISECVNQKGMKNQLLKEKIDKDERYRRLFSSDYHLELAKDILMCSPPFIKDNQ